MISDDEHDRRCLSPSRNTFFRSTSRRPPHGTVVHKDEDSNDGKDADADADDKEDCSDVFPLDQLFISRDYRPVRVSIGPHLHPHPHVTFDVWASPQASTDYDLTGQVLWPVSILLAHYIVYSLFLNHHHTHDNHQGGTRTTVIELGAGGTAVPSLAAAFCDGVHQVIATDGNDHVVWELLEKNVHQFNDDPATTTITHHHSPDPTASATAAPPPPYPRVSALRCVWGDEQHICNLLQAIHDPSCHVTVVAADVVQWPSEIDPLLHTVKALLCKSNDHQGRFLLGIVNRSTLIYNLFFSTAANLGFIATLLNLEPFFPNNIIPIDCREAGGRVTEIYELTLTNRKSKDEIPQHDNGNGINYHAAAADDDDVENDNVHDDQQHDEKQLQEKKEAILGSLQQAIMVDTADASSTSRIVVDKIMHVRIEQKTLQESVSIAEQVWPAATYLAEFILSFLQAQSEYHCHDEPSHQQLQSIRNIQPSLHLYELLMLKPNVSIIELGAGVGLTGLELATQISNSKILLTDLPFNLPLLQRNIQLNQQVLAERNAMVHAQTLEWGKHLDAQAALDWCGCNCNRNKNEKNPILIVGSDCVYWEALHAPLETTIVSLLQGAPFGSIVILAGERRWKSDNCFFRNLGKKKWKEKECQLQLQCTCIHESVTRKFDENGHLRRKVMRVHAIQLVELAEKNK